MKDGALSLVPVLPTAVPERNLEKALVVVGYAVHVIEQCRHCVVQRTGIHRRDGQLITGAVGIQALTAIWRQTDILNEAPGFPRPTPSWRKR